MLNKIPDWLLEQQFLHWGRKFPKRGPAVQWRMSRPNPPNLAPVIALDGTIVKKCSLCYMVILSGGVFYANNIQYHHECEPNKIVVDQQNWPPRMRNRHMDHDPLPSGNLDDSEYRFWVGHMAEKAVFSSCRRCYKFCYSAEERLEHKRVPNGTDACTIQLVRAYNRLSQKNKCMICSSQSFYRRWGVPLCQVGNCVKRFMFETSHWIPLEMELMQGDREAPKIVDAAALVEEAERARKERENQKIRDDWNGVGDE